MPIEIRRLIFSDEELCELMTRFWSGGASAAEPGTVMGIERRNRDPFALACRVQRRSGRQSVDLFDQAQLCEVLITWCMETGVPLARKAHKAARVTHDGRIAFDVTLSPGGD